MYNCISNRTDIVSYGYISTGYIWEAIRIHITSKMSNVPVVSSISYSPGASVRKPDIRGHSAAFGEQAGHP
jgi:hypothetical protein